VSHATDFLVAVDYLDHADVRERPVTEGEEK
jgi:hypothetical protein